MACLVGVIFSLAVPTATLATVAHADGDPLQQVVHMLEDMRKGIAQDIDTDKAAHEKMDCWCQTSSKEKSKAISDAESKVPELEAFIAEAKARMDELRSKNDEARKAQSSDSASLKEATSIRMKESKAFMEEEIRLLAAIQATEQAVVVLSRHHSELSQVRTAAHRLQQAQVLSLASLHGAPADSLRRFLAEAQSGVSFLAVTRFQSYAPASGEVFGILRQMKEGFEHSLVEARAQEKAMVAEFETLKGAKSEELKMGTKLDSELSQQLAEFKEKHAQALKDLKDTKKQLLLDESFLQDVKNKCSTSDAEFKTRMKDLMEEVDAVEDTMQLLKSNDTLVTASFLQAASSTGAMEHARRQQAIDALKRVANGIDSPALLLMAMRLRKDALAAVSQSIDKMVAHLEDQQDDEAEHRDHCVEEMATNTRSAAAAQSKTQNLQAKMEDLQKTCATLQEEVARTQAQSAETQQQMKKASRVREEESADYEQTVEDQRLVQMVLQKAVSRLRQTYSLAQEGSGQQDADDAAEDMPSSGARSQAGSRVIAAIEKIIAGAKKVEDEALRMEQDAVAAYKKLMKESNNLVLSYGQKVSSMSEALAKANESLLMVKSDSAHNMDDLAALEKTAGILDKACSFILENFEARKAARTAEHNALKQARGILESMK